MRRWIGPIGLTVAVGVAYFLAARLSLLLLTKPDGVAVFWPAAGIAAGVLISLGPGARWPVAAAAIVATVAANLPGDRNLPSVIAFGVCNAAEALLAAWLIERWFGPRFELDRLSRVLGFVVASAMAASVSGLGGTWGYVLFHSSTVSAPTIWWHWFASDALGIISVAPLLVGFRSLLSDAPPTAEFIEGIGALSALTAVSTVAVFSRDLWPIAAPALLFPLMLWLTARCRPAFASAAAFFAALVIVWSTTFDMGYYGDPSVSASGRILSAQAAILFLSFCALVLAALSAERRDREDRRRMLMAELDHRVKNALARVAMLATSTRKGSTSIDEYVRSLNGRIQSMAAAHNLLSQRGWHNVGLAALVGKQLAPYARGSNVTIKGEDIILGAAEVQAVAMVLHELVTNAAKYGSLSVPDGRVCIKWDKVNLDAGAKLLFDWLELGGPPVAADASSGYGTSLIRDLIPHELGGTVALVFAPDGVSCKIEIPLEQT